MTKLLTIFLLLFALSNTSWARMIDNNSLSRAMLEINAMNTIGLLPKTDVQAATPYTHESERNNSLSRAALAIQGVEVNLRINSDSEISYSRHIDENQRNNSLFRGALAR